MENDLMSLSDIAKESHVTTQSVYHAVRKERVKGVFINKRWMISKKEYDEYRLQRYNRENHIINGEKLYSFDEGRFSVVQVAKLMSEEYKFPYTSQDVYRFIKLGHLKAHKIARFYIIYKEDLKKFLTTRKSPFVKRINNNW